MKTVHQQKIEEMMFKAGQDLPSVPTRHVTKEVRTLRARLILEECLETIKALGIRLQLDVSDVSRMLILEPKVDHFTYVIDDRSFNLYEIADGCADISVVTIGTLSAFGLDDHEVLDEVDENNLKKFGPGGYRDQFGKWIKPPDHKPPDMIGVVERQVKMKTRSE